MRVLSVFIFLSLAGICLAQSDFIPKGSTGFEINYLYTKVEESEFHGALLSASIQGVVDLGALFSGSEHDFIASLVCGLHGGGDEDKVGAAFHVAYNIISENENYFAVNPSLYANFRGKILSVLPAVSVIVPIKAGVSGAFSFGLSLRFGNTTSFTLRPSLTKVFEGDVYFGIGIGLLYF